VVKQSDAGRAIEPARIRDSQWIEEPIGLPQINIAGGELNFGGPSAQPSGRGDTTFVLSDTLNLLKGKHSLKFGGEFRQFLNNNFRRGTGSFNFPSIASFIAGTANSFSRDARESVEQHLTRRARFLCTR
jgi:hypothetical protein